MYTNYFNNNGVAWRTRPGYPIDHTVHRISPVKLRKDSMMDRIKRFVKNLKIS